MDNTPTPASESVFFYTFHKCASTLFAGFILPNTIGLNHVDYAKQFFTGSIGNDAQVIFEKSGHIYGPIRISARTNNPIKGLLVDNATDQDFIRDKIAVFFVRDPRDILVSSYYSFGFSHKLSVVPEVRKSQEATRDEISRQTIDEFVMGRAQEQKLYFQKLDAMVSQCKKSQVIYYEEMIDDFDVFANKLTKHIPLDKEIIKEMYIRTRPKPVEDRTLHRRSGRVGGFREHLKPETIKSLNQCLSEILATHGYYE